MMLPMFRTMPRAVLLCCAVLIANAQSLPDGPGRELVQTICSECHEPTKVVGQHKTKVEWQAKVTEMLQEDQDVTQQEREIIINYLAVSFPSVAKVNVNKAPPADLESVLEIPGKDAQAIVRYREENGAFKSLEDLKKVAGLDGATVDGWKERVEF
jgi:competence protein ComEA